MRQTAGNILKARWHSRVRRRTALTRPLAALLNAGRLKGDLAAAAAQPADGAAAGLDKVEHRGLALLKLALAWSEAD